MDLKTWWDYVEVAVVGDGTGQHLLPIAITSQAEGAMPSEGWPNGQGKSTLAMQISKKIFMELYGYDEWIAEELIKKYMIGDWDDYKRVMELGLKEDRVGCLILDDFHKMAGKHVAHNKSVQWTARDFDTKRPYLGVVLAPVDHIGSLCAAWRGKWMFEIKVYEKGKYEVQFIKTKTNFRKPEDPYKILDKNTIRPVIGTFPNLSGEIMNWYKDWRHTTNIREFEEGWAQHFGENNKPMEVREELTSMNRFTEAVRGIGIKASEEKLRTLYNEFIKPTVALAQ